MDEYPTLTHNAQTAKYKAVCVKRVLKGKVVEKVTEKHLPNVRIRLFKTMVRIVAKDNYDCYGEPDTATAAIGTLKKGDYPVLDTQIGKDTDYILIKTKMPDPSEGWICSKWEQGKKIVHGALLFDQDSGCKETTSASDGRFVVEVSEDQLYRLRFVLPNYFDAESQRVPPSATDMPLIKMETGKDNVQESVIVSKLKDFRNFSYAQPAKYPYDKLAGVSVPMQPPKQNDCCTFVEALLVKSWEDAVKNFSYDKPKHEKWINNFGGDGSTRMQVLDPVIDTGMGTNPALKEDGTPAIGTDKKPTAWTIVQGYELPKSKPLSTKKEKGWDTGHMFIIVDIHPETDRVLVLESNTAGTGLNGPGFRKLNHIDKFEAKGYSPGNDWWDNDQLPTWEDIKASYKYFRMARLNVYDLKWVK
jgi:hypothetical protein